ncbi:hypothetical protein SAMN04487893_10496 [Myroides guanonis]|uniref:Uncharacterized protein n=1 Tax=Myroides guanonis TaxID=1150112 RepID=A0A1I3PED5_9FLAO|nr:hypothetical protein SAMN04487893_10496 [Myroides guanonis]
MLAPAGGAYFLNYLLSSYSSIPDTRWLGIKVQSGHISIKKITNQSQLYHEN